jgi:hypothetical protein
MREMRGYCFAGVKASVRAGDQFVSGNRAGRVKDKAVLIDIRNIETLVSRRPESLALCQSVRQAGIRCHAVTFGLDPAYLMASHVADNDDRLWRIAMPLWSVVGSVVLNRGKFL